MFLFFKISIYNVITFSISFIPNILVYTMYSLIAGKAFKTLADYKIQVPKYKLKSVEFQSDTSDSLLLMLNT